MLTLSLHHPFPIPQPYKTLLDSIKDPVKKSLKYTDLSLQLFFNEIKKEAWYHNSIITICRMQHLIQKKNIYLHE